MWYVKEWSFLTHFILIKTSQFFFSLLQNREREMKQKVENKEESTLELHNTFSSLQQEVEIKTKKLKKVSLLSVF